MWTCFHTRCLLSVYEFDLADLRERHLADPFRPSRRPFGKVLLLHSGSRKYSDPVFPLCNTATSRRSSRPHSCFCFRPRAFEDPRRAFFFFCAARISCLFDLCFQWSRVYDWVYQSSLSMVLSARRLLFIANVIVGPVLVAWLKTNMSLLNFHFLELIRFDSLPFSPNTMEPTAPVCRAGGWVPKTPRRASWAQNCSNLISPNNTLWLVLVVNMWDQWSLLRNRLGSPQRAGNPFICVV